MKLFTKEIDLKLFKQYPKGGDLKNQVVVTKIFNPYNAGRWYLINSDPDDPNYLWAIVQMGSTVEVGSVSRKELENIRIKPFNLPLERDLYFDPVNAAELFKGLSEGKFYKAGGWTEGSENKAMLLNQAEGFEHHAEELEKAVKASDHIPAWVVAKSERASTDLSDITHYLDGENEQKREMVEGEEEEEYADGGEVKWQEAEYGDNALVVSENKMGVIIKPYGRKFHLKFVDGTEKTYDASELKFFKDMDDFDRGGKMAYGGIMNVGRYYKDKKGETFRFVGNETFINKNGEYVRKSITEFYEGGGDVKNRYKVTVYHGGEGKDEVVYADSISEAREKAGKGEHAEIYDTVEKEEIMANGGDVKKQEWVAVYVNQEKPSERKIIQAFGNTKEEATRNARMSEGYHGIKKPFELTQIYTYSGNLPMMADGGLNSDAAYKRKMKEFGFKPFGKTKGKFKVVYKDDGIAQTEVWESMEMAMSAAKKYLRMPNVSGVKILDESDMEIEIMASGGMMAKGGWLKSHKQEDFYYYSTPDKKIKTPFWYSVHEVKDIGSKETLHWTVERGGTNDMGYLRNYARKNFESKDEALKYAKSWEKEIANKYKWSRSTMADGGMMAKGGYMANGGEVGQIIVVENKLKSGSKKIEAYLVVDKSNPFVLEFKNRAIYCLKFSKVKEGEWHFYNVAVGFTKDEFDELKSRSVKASINNTSLLIGVEKKIIYELMKYEIDYLLENGFVLDPLMIEDDVTYSVNKIDDDMYIVNESFTKKGKLVNYQNSINSYSNLGSNVFKAIDKKYKNAIENKEKMAEGGEVKFKDKVASVKASHLKRKKVPKAVQKDYGKTFSPAEAEDSAKRIVGAMTAKERLQARLKKRKK